MSHDLISYLKTQNDNPYSLSVGEASSHMLAIHKFMEVYLNEFILKIDNESERKYLHFESQKIQDFLFVMTNILASSNSDNYFHDSILISKSQLEDFKEEISDAERLLKEELYHAIQKTSLINHKISDKLSKF